MLTSLYNSTYQDGPLILYTGDISAFFSSLVIAEFYCVLIETFCYSKCSFLTVYIFNFPFHILTIGKIY